MDESVEFFYDYAENGIVYSESNISFEFNGNNEEWDKLSNDEFWS